MDDSLKALATAQKRWSITADALKVGIARARMVVMALAVSAAVVETLAAQTSGPFALALGYSGAACLAVLAIVR